MFTPQGCVHVSATFLILSIIQSSPFPCVASSLSWSISPFLFAVRAATSRIHHTDASEPLAVSTTCHPTVHNSLLIPFLHRSCVCARAQHPPETDLPGRSCITASFGRDPAHDFIRSLHQLPNGRGIITRPKSYLRFLGLRLEQMLFATRLMRVSWCFRRLGSNSRLKGGDT